MTLRNVHLNLALKTQLELTKTPGVLTNSHSFTENIVLTTEICATLDLFYRSTPIIPPKDPTQFNILT